LLLEPHSSSCVLNPQAEKPPFKFVFNDFCEYFDRASCGVLYSVLQKLVQDVLEPSLVSKHYGAVHQGSLSCEPGASSIDPEVLVRADAFEANFELDVLLLSFEAEPIDHAVHSLPDIKLLEILFELPSHDGCQVEEPLRFHGKSLR